MFNIQMKKIHAKRPGRGCLLWLGRIGVLSLGLIIAGVVYESISETADARAYPPPGQMVDVGGYRLHINCMGTGSPTVVVDAGSSNWSTTWGYVQPEVAKTTRICTYDRAGLGWSESGPLPRNAKQFARELHTLLQQADVPGPYVMVGHSLGGLTVRVFAHDYSSKVAGAVLVDSMNPRQLTRSSTDASSRRNSYHLLYSVLPSLARVGAVRLFLKPALLTFTPPDENIYNALFVRPQFYETLANEAKGEPESAAQAGEVTSFGDLPLLVLSRGLNQSADWQAWQAELVQLSSNSEQVIADKSGHNIEIDQPQVVIDAIVKMVEQIRQQ